MTILLYVQLAFVLVLWIAMLKKYKKILKLRYKVTMWAMILMQILIPVLFMIVKNIH